MKSIPVIAWVVALITAGVIVITLITKQAPQFNTPSFTIGQGTLTAGLPANPTGALAGGIGLPNVGDAPMSTMIQSGAISPALNPINGALSTPITDINV